MSVNDTILSIIIQDAKRKRNENNENLKYLEIFSCSQVSEEVVEQLRSETSIEIVWP
jgi:hypothetical protein